MVRLYLVLVLAQIVLAVVALISCVSAEDDEIRGLPRALWMLLIVLFPFAGSIAWFVARRPSVRWFRGRLPSRENRPLGPDDDPEFLRSISVRRAEQEQEMFKRWEADLRSDDDVRHRDGDSPPKDRD